MKQFFLFLFTFFTTAAIAQKNSLSLNMPDSTKKLQLVEAACGQCQFGMPGKSCDLAVRIDGHAYYVTGTAIDDHGDAHAKDGFCNAIRKAAIQGEIKEGKFAADYFNLVDEPVKKKIN